MRKRKLAVLFTIGCLGLGMTACGEKAETQQTPEDAQEESAQPESGEAEQKFDAKAFVDTLLNGDAASLETEYAFTDELTSALSAQGGLAGLQTQLKTLGAVNSMEDASVTESGGYTVYSVPCSFESQNLDVVLSIDGENYIAGIVMGQYTGTAGEETASLPSGISEEELVLPVKGHDGWELGGTLTIPKGDGPFPAVVLVQGSGASDRDETVGANKPFRDIAWGLAQKGIAVYRYDKRTYVYGQEIAADTSFTLDGETVDDAAAAAELLKSQEKIDSSYIFILGHSLGGQAIPRIAERCNEQGVRTAGYIFLAAPARPLDVVMREQFNFLGTFPENQTDEAKAQIDAYLKELDRLQDIDAIPGDEMVMNAYPAYWKDLLAYDQVAMAADMTEPCLMLQGEEDYQVTMEDLGIWQDAYKDRENWQFTTYPGLTHMFMEGKKSDGAAAYNAAQQVDEQVITDIAAFVEACSAE